MADEAPVGGGIAVAGRRKRRTVFEARRKKEFTYRGKTLPQVLALPLEEQVKMLPSRMRRIFRRGLTAEQHKLLQDVRKTEPGTQVRTHRREMPILPEFVGHTFAVHNGKEFRPVKITGEMIGHYLGEYAMTRKPVTHGGVGVGATRSSKFMPLK